MGTTIREVVKPGMMEMEMELEMEMETETEMEMQTHSSLLLTVPQYWCPQSCSPF